MTKNPLKNPILILSSLCLTASAFAGDVDSKATPKEGVIQKPPTESRFYLNLSAGGEFDIHATKFISDGGGDLPVRGALLPTKVESRDFTAVHDPGVVNGVLEGGVKLNEVISLFAGFTYSHADGDTHSAGRVTDPTGAFGPLGGIYELKARVSEYEGYTGRGGFKLTLPRTILDFIHAPRFIKPYFSASAGGKYVKSSYAQFTAGNFLDTRAGLYDGSWVFTSEANLGYEFEVSRCFSFIFESGYGYDSKPERSDDRLPGVSGVNDGGNRLYSNVSLGAKFKF